MMTSQDVLLNPGIAFGWGREVNLVWLVLGLVLVWLVKRKYSDYRAANWIAAGGLSNQIDRLCRGGVVDYLSLSFLPTKFNLADLMVLAGIIGLMYSLVYEDKNNL